MDRKAIGQRLKKRREELDLSLRDLAAKVGIDHSYVRYVERGEKNVTIGVLRRMAEALKVPLDDVDLLDDMPAAPNATNLVARLQRVLPYVKPDALDTLRHIVEGWERQFMPAPDAQLPKSQE